MVDINGINLDIKGKELLSRYFFQHYAVCNYYRRHINSMN